MYELGGECQRATGVTTIGTCELKDLLEGFKRNAVHVAWERERTKIAPPVDRSKVYKSLESHVVGSVNSKKSHSLRRRQPKL